MLKIDGQIFILVWVLLLRSRWKTAPRWGCRRCNAYHDLTTWSPWIPTTNLRQHIVPALFTPSVTSAADNNHAPTFSPDALYMPKSRRKTRRTVFS